MADHEEHCGRLSETAIKIASEGIERALAEARDRLARMEPSDGTRHLKLSLDAFRRIMDSWRTLPPTRAQLALIRDHLTQLLETTGRGAATTRIPRSA
jgi:hypothetical protein